VTKRRLSIGLLAAALCGGCGGSAAKGDGGVDAGAVDQVANNLLVGTIDPTAQVICITAPLKLSGGQAQCTVVQHLAGDGGVITTTLPSCNSAAGPCWSLITSPSSCPDGGLSFTFDPDPANPTPDPTTLSYDFSCQLNN
jgi:hypothetical protein